MPYPDAMSSPSRSPALLGWRLLALMYDALPVVALWMLISTVFTLAYTYLGQHAVHENIAPFSLLQWLLWLCCWLTAGLYAVSSWKRGGQTLGMRPWRLTVSDSQGAPPTTRALWLRYAVASLSLFAIGLGFLWAWVDRQGLTWHDRASGTRLQRLPK
jgi:uncharacterized RDD family membrane protein YckC